MSFSKEQQEEPYFHKKRRILKEYFDTEQNCYLCRNKYEIEATLHWCSKPWLPKRYVWVQGKKARELMNQYNTYRLS